MKPIHKYALHGNLEQLKHELDSGISVDEPESKFQLTPLHVAIIKRQVAIVDLLLDFSADIYITESSGRTPLDMAISFLRDAKNPKEAKDSLDIIELILSKEVELRLQGKYADKPLLKDIKNKFNLTPGDHLNSKPESKRLFIELTKKAESKIARGKQIEDISSTSKIVSGLRNRKPDATSLAKQEVLELENSQNTDPNSSMPSKDSWLPSVFHSIFGSSSASEERKALLDYEKRSPKNNH